MLYLNGVGADGARAGPPQASRAAFDVEHLDLTEQHVVEVTVGPCDPLDCVTDHGLAAVGLPVSYPVHADGSPVPHSDCRPVGAAAYDSGMPGVACRSAAVGAAAGDAEPAMFDSAVSLLEMTGRRPFRDWYLAAR